MIKVRIKKVPQARTGYQVQGALVNDVPAMGGADYNAYIGKPKLIASKYITAVPRDQANLEAEGGETVYGDINGDGMPEQQIIKGPRHSAGGVPLNLPEDTFIFSDTRGMLIKDPNVLSMFGKTGKGKSFTPAELAKQYDIQKYRKILEDPDTDAIERKSAELMMKKYVIKLGCLALAQESMKGFPQGIPAVAKPCMEARGLTEEQILPSKEISVLNEQLKKQMKQQENSDQTMESENEQNQMMQAQEMNQGQPVAQGQEQPMSQEEMMMMYGGGMRRLRRAQAGMQQPSPEEMAMMEQQAQGQQQGGGQDEMMQIMQEIQGALQRGAEPAEVVMSLLQNGLPPEAIVQIFTQMGVAQEEAVGLIQEVMSQGQGGQEQGMSQQPPMEEEQMVPPMAAYGMSIGGYDMPFYDLPEAAYGMSMGAGMSQNYQGRPKPIRGSGPMFPLAKAQDGIIIDGTKMSEEQIQRAIWNAQEKDKADWLDKNPGKTSKDYPGSPKIIVTRTGADGKVKQSKLKSSGFIIPEGKDIKDLKGFPDTPAGRVAASQYLLIEQNLNNPIVRAEIIKNTKQAINNPDAWTGKSGTRDPNRNWTKIYGDEPSDDDIIKQALNHQKRNLMFEANEVDPQLFTDVGNGLDNVDEVINAGYINPNTGKAYTRDEATAELKRMTNAGYTSVASMSDKLGVPLDPKGKDRVLQQATMHGYAKSYQDFESGSYDSNPDAKYAMDNFLGNVSLVNSGAADEKSMGKLYGTIGNKISPLDDTYDYDNKNWYGSKRGTFTTYGNTTAGQKYMVGKRNLEFEDLLEEEKEKGKTKKCPCQKADGTVIEMVADANNNCPPCTDDEDISIPGEPPGMWLQDTIKTTGAFGDLMGLKKRMPWAPPVALGTPRPVFMDPTRDLAANAEQAAIQTQGMAQFAGPQAFSSRSSSIQGQASKNAADILSKYNNANINVANQFEMKANDIRNQNSMLNQATNQRLYDQNTVANQQFDNAKLAMRNNLRNYYTQGITNKWKTDALNQMYPNYAVNAPSGGRMDFRPTSKTFDGQGSSTSMTMQEAMDWCKQNNPNATDHSACMNRVLGLQNKSGKTNNAPDPNMVNNVYGSQDQQMGKGKKGGSIGNNSGYIDISSWLPFLL
jgi:hypothetical protein